MAVLRLQVVLGFAIGALFVGFPATAQNLVTNPSFEDALNGWTASSGSWSIQMEGLNACAAVDVIGIAAYIHQCVPATGEKLHRYGARSRRSSGTASNFNYVLRFYSEPGCSGEATSEQMPDVRPIGSDWLRFESSIRPPTGTQSARIWVGSPPGDAGTILTDDILLEMSLFDEGFETGTCSGWSLARPFCATPGVGLRVEVTWETANDLDPGDGFGTDLDLHLLHPDGSGQWLGAFDCYQANALPDWGTPGSAQNAILIREDNDGTGPEAIQITDPQSIEYDIAVHYVDDLGFGSSDATLTITVDGVPIYEYPGKALSDGDFWHLGSVEWPGGTVTLVDSVTEGVPD